MKSDRTYARIFKGPTTFSVFNGPFRPLRGCERSYSSFDNGSGGTKATKHQGVWAAANHFFDRKALSSRKFLGIQTHDPRRLHWDAAGCVCARTRGPGAPAGRPRLRDAAVRVDGSEALRSGRARAPPTWASVADIYSDRCVPPHKPLLAVVVLEGCEVHRSRRYAWSDCEVSGEILLRWLMRVVRSQRRTGTR